MTSLLIQVLVICYGLILRRISNRPFRTTRYPSSSSTAYMTSKSGGKRRKSSGKSDRDRTKMTVMCAALVGTFVVCWLPYHAVHLAKIAGIKVSPNNVSLFRKDFYYVTNVECYVTIDFLEISLEVKIIGHLNDEGQLIATATTVQLSTNNKIISFIQVFIISERHLYNPSGSWRHAGLPQLGLEPVSV